MAQAYLGTKQKLKRGGEAGRWMSPLETHIFPTLGDLSVIDLTVDNVSDTLQPIWQDKHPTAVKALTRLGQIIRWSGGRPGHSHRRNAVQPRE
ncbi:phage integrase central domain-containing protein [Octadecabacter arcticus]|uniref:phage integrase central domain-containing protein n=1 Tax=Octadecabacter arcticus TaxID=53946 RepID=UPI003B832C3C